MIAEYSVTLENKTKSELILFINELQDMLKEKDKEIERLEKVLEERYLYVPGMRTVYARLMSLDKEDIVKNDLALRNEIYQHIEDNDKKDKIIDLMARAIDNYDSQLVINTFKDKEHVKQYFEKLAERKSKNEN